MFHLPRKEQRVSRWHQIAFLAVAVAFSHPSLIRADLFTFAVLPDTQYYSESFPAHFSAQTQWIVDNRSSHNIVFVSHVGDLVENGAQGVNMNSAEWMVANSAMGILDSNEPDLAYGAVLGNHDYDVVHNQSSANQYVNYFGSSRYAGSTWYGGSSADQFNHYQVFSAGGREFLHLALEWQPRASSVAWAQSVLDMQPDTPTIITTHEYSVPFPFGATGRTGPGDMIFDELVNDSSQVFMVLSGHVLGEFHSTAVNDEGEDVFELLANYQGRDNGGDGWMRLLEFDENNNQINVRTYSPTLGQFETDSDSQFSLAIDFDSRLGAVTAVPEPSSFLFGSLFFGIAFAFKISRGWIVDQ